MATTRRARGPAGDAHWAWEEDEQTLDIVRRLRSGEALETRQFLKPIFRWMKIGVHKDGKRDEQAVEKAFAFVDWMVQLAAEGDDDLGVPALPQVQPSYALNTIVTASQRAGSLEEAARAFELLLAYGFEPDVFTYTALIDVTARTGDVDAAIERYEAMRTSSSRPNIVTYTTLIRSVGYSDSVDPGRCLAFLAHARDDNTFDDSLFLEALTTCARRKNLDAAEEIMARIASESPKLRADDRFFHVVADLAAQFDNPGDEDVLQMWLARRVLSPEEHQKSYDARDALKTVATNAPEGSKVLGCLGYQTSESVRKAVVQHDITRLMTRLRSGALVTVNDFETLIHQCRKRKWKEDIVVILKAMREVADHGWRIDEDKEEEDDEPEAPATTFSSSGSTDSTSDGALETTPAHVDTPPQPQLLPTSKTYISVIDAYLTCGDEPAAWEVVEYVSQQPGLEREFGLYRKFIRGAYLITKCDHIAELLQLAQEDGITFTTRMCAEVARMFGYLHSEGFGLISTYLPDLVDPAQAKTKQQAALEELVKSCAFKQNERGVEETLKSMLAAGFERSAITETAVFIACIQHSKFGQAKASLAHFQREKLVMRIPVYDSLLHEMYFKYTRRGSVFDEASRKVAMKTLYVRRALFEQAFKDRAHLETASDGVEQSIGTSGADPCGGDLGEGEPDNSSALHFWCRRSKLRCAPLMFAQHAVEILTTIRDKESKQAAEEGIRATLVATDDPVMFLLRAVTALRFLDLTYRALGKLAKQLLSLITEELQIEKRHAEFCISQLPLLTVHIVKELDDAVGLYRDYAPDLLAFALEALERDNVDKVVGFLTHREQLYSLETAKLVTPKLADLFVYGGSTNVVQYYKLEAADSLEMRRMFAREVMEMESLDLPEEGEEDEGDSPAASFPCTSRAIRELRLQHEPEFMPYVMRSLREVERLTFTTVEHDEDDGVTYLKLPLDQEHVVVVDNDDAVTLAYDVLKSDAVTALGLDAEWRPDRGHGTSQSKCSVLQVACATHVFLFDLIRTSMGDLEDLFAHLFASERVVKLGFGLDGDIKRLRWSFPETKCFDVFKSVVDLSFEAPHPIACIDGMYSILGDGDGDAGVVLAPRQPRRAKGLSAVVKETLGLPLRKTQQRSDWERRPLTPAQLSYAALDAFCLLMLHDALQQEASCSPDSSSQ